MMHHRNGPGAPPPPMLSRSGRVGGSRRSRSRSRSPRSSPRGGAGNSGRYRNERDSRDGKDRDRRRSPSPYSSKTGSSSRTERSRDRDRKPLPASKSSSSSSTLDNVPAVSIIRSEPPAIIRRILNPEEVKIPRRVNEGSKPIFERDELKEAMERRIKNNDNEENPGQPNAYIQEPTVTQQRVVAIIREPVGGNSLDTYLGSKDPAFHHALKLASSGTSKSHSERVSPPVHEPKRSFSRRSRSPSPRAGRQVTSGSGGRRLRSRSPPIPSSSHSRSIDREREHEIREMQQRERERMIMEREKALERDREDLLRQQQQQLRGSREHLPLIISEREREARARDLRRPSPELHTERNNMRRVKSRFSGGSPPPIHSRMEVSAHPNQGAGRSRSPVIRVPREDVRLRRRSRSHSNTPPPMPEDFRRQLILDRQKQIDLRNSLSRQPAKFGDVRIKGRPVVVAGRGAGRGGRGGFNPRPTRGREDDRRAWLHDMYDGEDEPKKG